MSRRLSTRNGSALRKILQFHGEEGQNFTQPSPFSTSIPLLRPETLGLRWCKSPWRHRGKATPCNDTRVPVMAAPSSHAARGARPSGTATCPGLGEGSRRSWHSLPPRPAFGPRNPPDLPDRADTADRCFRPHSQGFPRQHRCPWAGAGVPGR